MSRLDELIQKLCPNGVEYRKLGELGKFFGGITGKSKDDFTDGNAKFITYKNVYDNPSLQIDVEERVKIADGEKQRTLQYGDVIFTGSSETPDECGMSSVVTVKTEGNLYLNSFCFFFRFDDMNIMLPGFAKHLFRSNELRYQIGKTANGVTRYNISKKMMEKVSIPVPPLEVQREIVRILDSFTLLTTELKAELTARKKQYEYYRDELLEALHTEGVEYKKLGDIGQVKMCKRILKSQTNTIGEIPFYKIGTFGGEANSFISKGLYEEYKEKYSYPKIGEILISAAGTIGRTVVYDGEPAYYQDSNIVWLSHNESDVLNTFLRYCYELKPWSISSGGTIPRLYNDNILKAKIPVPPIEVQREIVRILDSFTELTGDLTAELTARQKQYEFYRDKLLSFKQL